MLRIVSVASAFLLVSCISASHPNAVPGYEIRSRLQSVSIGQSIAEVHEIVGDAPVRRPNHPDAPIPSPIRTIEFKGSDGRVTVEVYVVDAWRAEGCPDFHYQDIPISYLDGRVISKHWNYLEWHWQGWGGSIADLRHAQDRFLCRPAERHDGR